MKASQIHFRSPPPSSASSASPLLAQDGWVNLFNGKNLDGWAEHSGQAKYTVADGVLTGESVSGTGNSFLCTTQTFGNFELELEYKCDALLNSGVQIRSEVFPDATHADHRRQGIQVRRRIASTATSAKLTWTPRAGGCGPAAFTTRRGAAGFFRRMAKKARRAWRFPNRAAQISKNGEWNKLRIVANGPSIKTWLNGVPRAEICDDLTPRGVIGLQVHGVGQDTNKVGLKVSFRNIRIRELEPDNTLTEAGKGRRLETALGRQDHRRLAQSEVR